MQQEWKLPRLTLTVREEANQRLVELRGELDIISASIAEHILVGLAGSRVTADLEELSYLDVVGLIALLRAKERIEQQGNDFEVRNVHGTARLVMETSGVKFRLIGA